VFHLRIWLGFLGLVSGFVLPHDGNSSNKSQAYRQAKDTRVANETGSVVSKIHHIDPKHIFWLTDEHRSGKCEDNFRKDLESIISGGFSHIIVDLRDDHG